MSALGAAAAAAEILAHTPRLPPETVPLADALGRVAAEDVRAGLAMPPWRAASMDGYAIRAADLEHGTPVRLTVTGDVAAGGTAARALARGEAVRIATGAPVPDGADSVIRVEDTDAGRATVEIRAARDALHNVRPAGEDYRSGDVLVRAGEHIGPATIGVLASAGITTIAVVRRPTVAIVGSGDELVLLDDFQEVTAGRRIVSSNSYTLPAQTRLLGAIPRDFGVARDSADDLRARIEMARGCDLLITTAGVSVGERDHTRATMEALGARLVFWRVRIRPGAPMAFGTLDGIPWLGLSGNPVSAMVTFELFARPAILRMSGHELVHPRTIDVTLVEPVTIGATLTHFLRAVVTPGDAGVTARLTGTQSSGALTSMQRANALLVVPPERQRYEAGETLRAIPLRPPVPGDPLCMSDEFPA